MIRAKLEHAPLPGLSLFISKIVALAPEDPLLKVGRVTEPRGTAEYLACSSLRNATLNAAENTPAPGRGAPPTQQRCSCSVAASAPGTDVCGAERRGGACVSTEVQ